MDRRGLFAALIGVAACSSPLDGGGGGTGGTSAQAGTGGTSAQAGTGGTSAQAGTGGIAGQGTVGTGGYGLGGASGTAVISGRGGAGGAGGELLSPCGGAVVRSTPYQLVRKRNLASPVPNPVGITFDGQMLWIMEGAYSPPDTTATLVRFDPDQLTVDRTFTFDNLMETAGAGVYGITWDGSAIWISVGGNRNKLVKVDPTTGQITRTMSSPSELGPVDLDFLDGTLWLSSGTGTVFALDPKTGGIDHMVSVPPGFSGRDDGVAARAGELWVGALFGGMCVEDPATGAPLAEVVHDDGTQLIRAEIGASVFIGSQLVTATGRGITYYDIH